MLFVKIPYRMTAESFAREFPASPITAAKEKNYTADKWPAMQNKSFATIHEPVSGGEILYQLTFDANILSILQLSIDADFTENSYKDLLTITDSIVKAQTTRGITAAPENSRRLAWKELIESPLPDSGRADGRFISVEKISWPLDNATAQLTFSWTWPGQLCLGYREEKK